MTRATRAYLVVLLGAGGVFAVLLVIGAIIFLSAAIFEFVSMHSLKDAIAMLFAGFASFLCGVALLAFVFRFYKKLEEYQRGDDWIE